MGAVSSFLTVTPRAILPTLPVPQSDTRPPVSRDVSTAHEQERIRGWKRGNTERPELSTPQAKRGKWTSTVG